MLDLSLFLIIVIIIIIIIVIILGIIIIVESERLSESFDAICSNPTNKTVSLINNLR